MLAIKNNLMAENAARHLGQSYDALAKSVERLSSGLRINSAKDDAAGLAVRELMRAEIATLKQGTRNAQDGISMLQTMEGALAQTDEILVRMKELAEQAATGSYSDDQRTIMNAEFAEMSDEIDRIVANTDFNGIFMLNSALAAAVQIHVGSDTTIDIDKYDMTASGLGVDSTLGTKEAWTSKMGWARADDTAIAAADIDSSDANRYIHFKFSGDGYTAAGEYITVDLLGYSATGITLNELVKEINDAWDADADTTDGSYAIATAAWDADFHQYKLQLENDAAAAVTFQINSGGTTSGVALFDSRADFTRAATGAVGTGLSLNSETSAVAALATIDAAIVEKDEARAALGYKMNRLESTVSILQIQTENLMASESRISDVDVATELAQMTRNQVLAQAGIAMLAQSNTMPQMALQLLR